jgi:hypothetical protein
VSFDQLVGDVSMLDLLCQMPQEQGSGKLVNVGKQSSSPQRAVTNATVSNPADQLRRNARLRRPSHRAVVAIHDSIRPSP